MKLHPSEYAKALVGATVAGLSALIPLMDHGVTVREALTVVLAALIGGGAVFGTPNRPPAGKPSDPRISEQGYGAIELVVGVLLVVILVVLLLRLL